MEMYFKEVEIKNFKGIAAMKLMFKPGVNLLIGENGVGKTSVLEALTIALSDFFNGISGVPKKGIVSADVRFNTHAAGNASMKIEYYTPTEIHSKVHLSSEVGAGLVSRRDETGQSRTKYAGKGISMYASKLCNDMDSTLPLLCYISTQRLAQPKREDFGTSSKNELNDRRCGYIGCMEDSLDRKALEAWCLKMEMCVFKQNAPIHEYEMFKDIVSTFMMHMKALEQKPHVDYSRQFDQMVYREDDVSTPIKYLSAGYQSLLWIVMTMAFRLCQLNPNVKEYKDVPGIVIIDEIDMHLHPRWQWIIVDALQKTFPKIQFILATHAPIILSSCRDALLIRLSEERSVQYLESVYGTSIDDVAELTQGSLGIPLDLKKASRKFEAAFHAGQKEKAAEILSEMESQFGDKNEEVILAHRRFRLM